MGYSGGPIKKGREAVISTAYVASTYAVEVTAKNKNRAARAKEAHEINTGFDISLLFLFLWFCFTSRIFGLVPPVHTGHPRPTAGGIQRPFIRGIRGVRQAEGSALRSHFHT